MNFKRVSALVLALAMTASTAALAAEEDTTPAGDTPLLISANPNAEPEHYNGVVSINGTEVETVSYFTTVEGSWEEIETVVSIKDLPGAPAGYVPMRLLCQATEDGYASWFGKEENRSMFVLNEVVIFTNFADNSVYVRNESREDVLQEGVSCLLIDGVTFLPAEFLATLDGVSVDSYMFGDEECFDFTIEVPGTPMEKLIHNIQAELNMAGGMSAAEFLTAMELDTSAFAEITGEMPMMNIRADVVVIAKWAEDADKESGKAALKAIQDHEIQAFTGYLPGPLEVAENGQIVESADGKYVMLILSEDNEKAIELFQAGIVQVDMESTGIQPR